MAEELPDDPEREMYAALRQRFLHDGFVESEATRLADAWADPLIVSWEMAKHDIPYVWASWIFGPGKPSTEEGK